MTFITPPIASAHASQPLGARGWHQALRLPPSNFSKNFQKIENFRFFQKSYFGPKCIKTTFLDALTAPKIMPHPNIAPKSPYGHHRVPKIRKNIQKYIIYIFQKSYFGPKCIQIMFLDPLTAPKRMAQPNIASKSPHDHQKSGKKIKKSKNLYFFIRHIPAQNA